MPLMAVTVIKDKGRIFQELFKKVQKGQFIHPLTPAFIRGTRGARRRPGAAAAHAALTRLGDRVPTVPQCTCHLPARGMTAVPTEDARDARRRGPRAVTKEDGRPARWREGAHSGSGSREGPR